MLVILMNVILMSVLALSLVSFKFDSTEWLLLILILFSVSC
jgi:hypothetical protein